MQPGFGPAEREGAARVGEPSWEKAGLESRGPRGGHNLQGCKNKPSGCFAKACATWHRKLLFHEADRSSDETKTAHIQGAELHNFFSTRKDQEIKCKRAVMKQRHQLHKGQAADCTISSLWALQHPCQGVTQVDFGEYLPQINLS